MFNAYSNAVLGMLAQSQAMESIGRNVANMSTGGYKRSETNFHSVMSETFRGQSAYGGVNTHTTDHVYESGFMKSSSNSMDLAINGHGMYILNTQSDGSGDMLYGRDGQFETALGTDNAPYIVDKNGYFLMGWETDSSGIADSGTLNGINVNPELFVNNGIASTTASVQVNLPQAKTAGGSEVTSFKIYDGSGTSQLMTANWTKTATVNEWQLDMSVSGGTITAPATTQTITFGGDGSMTSPTSGTITVAGTVGAQAISFDFDIGKTTQFNGPYTKVNATADGQSNANLRSYEFNTEGYVNGRFTDSTTRSIYRIPLANFTNYNGLKPINGNVYQVSQNSGEATVMTAGAGRIAEFVPNSYETSNVKVDQEMTKMITTQQAYSTSATVFTTVDEMEKTAANLKR
ncbi:MAG: flagellar hook-basal body complex protein [Alphaproteobacteria bacterium]|nr:flagellar hook-basal body complex protein [Rhodospirillales bacterium]MCW9045828.1 flagellar hook-basal body complex protein [Alphaproteobacteria bacterium]